MSSHPAVVSTQAEEIRQRHKQKLLAKALSTEVVSTIPDTFYHSNHIYELERRAIFARKWILVCHKARIPKAGDYVQYDFAGYNIVLVKEKSGIVSSFHNICRHRAFPVVRESAGNARIFTCKYHGWSYDLSGKLTKAPRFTTDSTQAADTTKVRLYPVHVHVDRNGFVYVNLDAAETPEVSWESQYGQMDQQEALLNSGVDWDAIEYDFTWTKDGEFNWKVMQDNYNECYHCQIAHPDVAKTTVLDTYLVVPSQDGAYISHHSEPKDSVFQSSTFDASRFRGRSQAYVYPGGHFSPNPGTGFMHLMRSCPVSATKTRQEYDVYKLNTPTAAPEKHQRMIEFYQKVVTEDFDLCEGVQKNIGRGIFERGPLHPFYEEGVVAFQKLVLRDLREHAEVEATLGREVDRAKPKCRISQSSSPGLQGTAMCEFLKDSDCLNSCQKEFEF